MSIYRQSIKLLPLQDIGNHLVVQNVFIHCYILRDILFFFM
ncbi:hypothetical protein BNJ_00383 [Kaumoebavirus]|nr:hypothetical protein BNJ_00383 [Kaumoebavirus]ARA72202.1 hypothetical protein BNJ_00383 [Kaumoebavirus]